MGDQITQLCDQIFKLLQVFIISVYITSSKIYIWNLAVDTSYIQSHSIALVITKFLRDCYTAKHCCLDDVFFVVFKITTDDLLHD